jgi:hypothetical protein
VLLGLDVKVLCEVSPADGPEAAPVNPSTIKLEMLDAEGTRVDQVTGAATLSKAVEYAATFMLTSLPDDTGRISFRCSASDRSTPSRTGSDTVSTFVDRGPKIEVHEPTADSAHALGGAKVFEFAVTPEPLMDPDPGAALTQVTLEVDGNPISALAERTDNPGVYWASVNFEDTKVFPRTPTGTVPVVIRAQDARGALRTETYSIVVDGQGPVIKITSPVDKTVVGSQILLEFTVDDPLAGVDPATVLVYVNDVAYAYDPDGQWSQQDGKFSFRFSSGQIQGSVVQATLAVKAKDEVGNQSTGESLLIYIDTQPPLLDLDSGNVREVKPTGQCSDSFDPLGWQAASDTETVFAMALFRVLVLEQTNHVPGQIVLHHAGTVQDSVYLYLQPDPNTPLLIDTNGDGQCDELATMVGTQALPYQHLKPVTPAGEPSYGLNDFDTVAPTATWCVNSSSKTTPDRLCTPKVSDLTRVINDAAVGTIPAVYAIGTLAGIECTGSQWEIRQFVNTDSWICLAARGVDNVGNVGISRPLRVCMDTDGDPDAGSTVCKDTLPPTCTDGCTPPAGYAGGFFVRQ